MPRRITRRVWPGLATRTRSSIGKHSRGRRKRPSRFFFSSRRRHTRFDCDWSSDVCSSDLGRGAGRSRGAPPGRRGEGRRALPRDARREHRARPARGLSRARAQEQLDLPGLRAGGEGRTGEAALSGAAPYPERADASHETPRVRQGLRVRARLRRRDRGAAVSPRGDAGVALLGGRSPRPGGGAGGAAEEAERGEDEAQGCGAAERMILVRLDRLTHGFGARTLFENLSFRAGDDARVGLVGRNGTGKTTLLRILAGTLAPERGVRALSPRVRVGMLDQQIEPDGEETAFEYARDAFRDLLQLMEREEAVRAELLRSGDASEEELTALGHELGHLHDHFARMGGHSIESRVEETFEGLGVSRPLWTQPLRTLSGGEKGRVAIARLILSAPDLLLLDEPTNHLDMAATEWLENFLARSSEPFVLVSHDRTLLDRVCTSIAEIEHGGLEQHAGNYTEFARKKRSRMEQEAKRYALDLAERRRQEEFIRKNIAGQNTKQAQSRRKRL